MGQFPSCNRAHSHLWLSLVLLALAGGLFSQNDRLLRLEQDVRSTEEVHEVLPLGPEGLLVIYPGEERDAEGRVPWQVLFYDSAMRPGWKRTESLPTGARLIRGQADQGEAHLLFMAQDGSQGWVLGLDLHDGSDISIDFRPEERVDVHYFSRKGPYFLIGAADKKHRLQPWLLDSMGRAVRLETGQEEEQWLDDALWLEGSTEIVLAYKYRSSRRSHGIRLQAYNAEGQRTWSSEFAERNDRGHSAARLAKGRGQEVLLVGAYSLDERTASYTSQSPAFETASGLFTARILGGDLIQGPDYHPFKEFANYFSHLSYNEVSRMKATPAESSPSVDFRVLMQGLRPVNGSFVLMAEAYYEKYHYVSRMSYDIYGRPVPSSYTVFDGYQYTNAFIAAFDSSGVRLWDNNVEMSDLLVQERRQFMEVLPDRDEIVLAWVDDSHITSQAIHGRQVTALPERTPLESPGTGQRSIEGENERIQYWYGHYALCSGYQKIRFTGQTGGDRRTLFYVSKVIYR